MSSDFHAAYEWSLSDHPDARAEREACRAEYIQHQRDSAARARAWAEKISAAPDAPQNLRDLAATSASLADQADARAQAVEADPDEVRVAKLRAVYEGYMRNSGPAEAWDYRYPQHLTGPEAASHPRPAEPEAGQ